MLKINHLKFEYRKEELILNDINFQLDKGKTYVLLGKNGAGKTTLLKCISGIYDVKEGEIEKSQPSIFIEDNPRLYYYLTGKEYIELVLTLSHHKNSDLVQHLVRELNMKEQLEKNIIDYSLGMKHKLALISALLLDYQFFLIDEPLTALDPETSRFMINYFKQMKKEGKTLLISTHMMHIAYELADEILILANKSIKTLRNDFIDFDAFENHVITELKVKL